MKERTSEKILLDPLKKTESICSWFDAVVLMLKKSSFSFEISEVRRMLDKNYHFYVIFKRMFAGIQMAMEKLFCFFSNKEHISIEETCIYRKHIYVVSCDKNLN